MIAIGRNLRTKHKKAQIIASMVNGLQVNKALEKLKYIPTKSAQMIFKILKSAISNAEHNFKKDTKDLFVKHIIVNKGTELKRIRPVSRGRSHRITKGVSHIRIILDELISNSEDKKLKTVKKNEVKKISKKQTTNKSNSK
jgi:large subunit ribosomal protein L22